MDRCRRVALYELVLLGNVSAADRERLTRTIAQIVDSFGLTLGADVALRDAANLADRTLKAATAAAYFGGAPDIDAEAVTALARDSVPIVPTIASGEKFDVAIPEALQAFNGHVRRADDRELVELATILLECVGLLRRQRRVFVSYRRVGSRSAAVQLHDLMAARGFDVFLDTHHVRAGDPFQDVLWHRLSDSDVMVMLDTPDYFDSKWTRTEFARARAKEIHILRVVWPAHVPNQQTDLAETVYLDQDELVGPTGPIIESTADEIVLAVERLRSRSIAARNMSITSKFRAEVERIGGEIEGIGAHRAIATKLPHGGRVWAYAVVGIPTAETLNDVAEKARLARHGEQPLLIYDHVGIRKTYAAHLQWLDENIDVVQTIKVSEAGYELAGL